MDEIKEQADAVIEHESGETIEEEKAESVGEQIDEEQSLMKRIEQLENTNKELAKKLQDYEREKADKEFDYAITKNGMDGKYNDWIKALSGTYENGMDGFMADSRNAIFKIKESSPFESESKEAPKEEAKVETTDELEIDGDTNNPFNRARIF